ncbi:MAG TPA: nicotinate phosphoribosyltransferase, partial [Acidimicrobiia bacterium]|nr:nicotinate phosphoribosyltransferase [Acidimicrobiia bacterium]
VGLAGESVAGAEALLVPVTPGGSEPAAAVAAASARFEVDWAVLPEAHKRHTDPAPYRVERSPGLTRLSGGG